MYDRTTVRPYERMTVQGATFNMLLLTVSRVRQRHGFVQ